MVLAKYFLSDENLSVRLHIWNRCLLVNRHFSRVEQVGTLMPSALVLFAAQQSMPVQQLSWCEGSTSSRRWFKRIASKQCVVYARRCWPDSDHVRAKLTKSGPIMIGVNSVLAFTSKALFNATALWKQPCVEKHFILENLKFLLDEPPEIYIQHKTK